MSTPASPATVIWGPEPQLPQVVRMVATNWRSDLSFFHESVNVLSIDKIEGDRGPVNHHRGRSHVCTPRKDVLLFTPGYAHRASGGPRANFRVLLIPPKTLARASLELTGRETSMPFLRFVSPGLQPLVSSLHRLLDDASPGPVSQTAVAYNEVVRFIARHCGEGAPPATERADEPAVKRAVEYIDDLIASAPDRDIDLEALAAASGSVGVYKLCRDFKALTSVSPYQYLKLRKVELGRRWLTSRRSRSILGIAQRLGYTPESFSRSFRQVVGISAREYRAALE